MKKTLSLTAITLACGLSMLTATAPSLADDNMSNNNPASNTQEMGEHHMDGTVTNINHSTGFINVKTKIGSMHLHYPPESTKDVKKGDKIRVYLGYSEVTKDM